VNIPESIQRKRKLQLLLLVVPAKAGAFAWVGAEKDRPVLTLTSPNFNWQVTNSWRK
jgi:hypothetical protein